MASSNAASDSLAPVSQSAPPFLPLPHELQHFIMSKDLSTQDLKAYRGVSKDYRQAVDSFVSHILMVLLVKGPSHARQFLAKQGPITEDNAWRILAIFKRAHPGLSLTMPITQAIQSHAEALQIAKNHSTITLKNALVSKNPEGFATLARLVDPNEIRAWFSNSTHQELLRNVLELDLSFKQIQVIPEELQYLSNLKKLLLSNNQISYLVPQAFVGLSNLQHLNLSNNQISTLAPEAFTGLLNLQYLGLHGNQISTLAPEAFTGLLNLQRLWISFQETSTLASGVFEDLPNLKSLWITDHPITKARFLDRPYLGLRPEIEVHWDS